MQKTPLIALVLFAACGDDPVNYSAPVGIELKAKSGDVANDAITEDKGITTESSNPYGAFVTEAKNRIGHDPSNIVLDTLTLTLGGQSTGVTVLEQVVTGDVVVKFLTNDTNNTFVVGHFASPTGPGPVDGDESFDMAADVGDQDIAKILGGSFHVVISATPATDFATKGAEASLELKFTFSAFE
ncbi:MAG TPA: hypothetical protein VFV99_12560 [Kofleriaceae bacterium]|nr:hypothetical protein [Kofleriaceae bacterium]